MEAGSVGQERVQLSATSTSSSDLSESSSLADAAAATPSKPTPHPRSPPAEARSLLDRTAEKIVAQRTPASPDNRVRRRDRGLHSRGSSSAESHDYVDALASSAFLNCRSAVPPQTANTPGQLASFVDTLSSAAAAKGTNDATPAPLRIRTFRPDEDDSESDEDLHDEQRVPGRTSLIGRELSSSDDAASEVAAPAAAAPSPPVATAAEAAHDTTIEVIVHAEDEEELLPPQERVAADAEESTADASTGSPAGVLRAVYGTQQRWSTSRPSLLHNDYHNDNEVEEESSDNSGRGATDAPRPAETTPVDAEVPVRSWKTVTGSPVSPSVGRRRSDSTEWAASRKTALEQLRAHLHPPAVAEAAEAERSARQSSRKRSPPPGRSTADTGGQPLKPSDSFEDLAAAAAADAEVELTEDRAPVPRPPSRTAASILEELLAEPSRGSTRSTRSPALTPETSTAHADAGEPGSLVASAAAKAGVSSSSASRLVIRPALSADVSGISPVKADASIVGAVVLLRTPETNRLQPRTLVRHVVPDAGEDAHELSIDAATADLRTALTAPSSSAATSLEATPVRDDTVSASAAVGAPPPGRPHAARLYHATPYDRQRIRAGAALPPATAGEVRSRLRSPQAQVRMFAAATPNAWESSQESGWYSPERSPSPPPQTRQPEQAASELSPAQHSSEAEKAAAAAVAAAARLAAQRQRQLQEEQRAAEMAECTFHPVLSPGTRAMVRLVQEREVARTLLEEDAGVVGKPAPAAALPWSAHTHPSPSAPDAAALKATLQTVYERLYPVGLPTAASRRQIVDQELEYRRLAREELILLRRRCGAARRVSRPTRSGGAARAPDAFAAFMSTILQVDWESATAAATSTTTAPGTSLTEAATALRATAAVVETSYKSPMAVAMLEEQYATRRYNSRREAEMQGRRTETGGVSGGAVTGAGAATTTTTTAAAAAAEEEDSFRIALFDEFLLRQDAHYFNRARTVRRLEKEMTPHFTPQTTDVSARLVRRMQSRSLLQESVGPETSAMVAQRERQGIPYRAAFVTPHTSPYTDECTFHPTLSAAARAAKEEERRRLRAAKQTPATQQATFFERLYTDQQRRARQREEAKKRADADEVEGLTFRPTVNANRNAGVDSVLHPRNYQPYQAYLQEKRQSLDALRKEQAEEARRAEEDVCTFRPQTTKKPAYISKMAKSFGAMRQRDTEF
ncbi:hypothetical protein NESM_000023700 [Novymonas esmeraldas]|uniref:Uncharacterized protein n=1 Tax=Novymonas esmeraldas TaxID=1808958 RepID=A0AAW0F2C6_9TRYP